MVTRTDVFVLGALILAYPGICRAADDKPMAVPIESEAKIQVIQAEGTVLQRGYGSPPVQVVPGKPPVVVPPGAKPPGSQKPPTPGSTPPKPGEEPGKAAEKPAIVKRPNEPPTPPDPKEMAVRPDKDGVVRFQFRGQGWPDVLEWLGEVSGMSVDWQELPSDYVNIATQTGYTVDEVRDLFNRLLLARGFTILRQDEFLIVVKCEELSAGPVPRVAAEDLSDHLPHEYVRVLFALDWLLADDAVKELEPLLSKNGKLYPLTATNRIEAMDAVVNLQQMHRLLTEEQSVEDGQPRLVHEFVLKYARAEEVREELAQFVGASSSSGSSSSSRGSTRGMSSQQMAQQQAMLRAQAQMQQQMQQQAKKSSRSVPTPTRKERPVRFLVNRRRNSILVHAPPDKMAIISDAIKLLDVAEEGAQSLQAFLGRMQVYRLSQLDPEKLVESLRKVGGLDPTTRLEVDEANRAIIAYASPADHFTIRSTVDKLDGSARQVEVIPLRNLAADEVAGTIQYLMSGSRDKSSSSSRYSSYDYMFGYRGRSSRSEENTDEFRVDADVMNNRLLVRANDMELEEVVSILVKLGEIPESGLGSSPRVLSFSAGENPADFLKQLQRDWKALGPNPLVLPLGMETTKEDKEERVDSAEGAEDVGGGEEPRSGSGITGPAGGANGTAVAPSLNKAAASMPPTVYQTALFQLPASDTPSRLNPPSETKSPPNAAAPIVVSIAPDGRVVLASQDPEALRLIGELAARLAPPQKDYKIFELKYAPASWVKLNLEDFFEEEDDTDNRRRNRMMSMIYGMPAPSSQSDGRRLSQRRKLRFISDLDTNTILVQGADAGQLKTIAELIQLYDVPEPVNSQNARVTKLFHVQYSQANVIAETVKDAYRDLLSDNDKSLQQKQQGKQPPRSYGGGMSFIAGFGLGDDSSSNERTSVRFKGKLSIGIDELTNTLLVSTEGENLMRLVSDMIESLDEAAKPVSQIRVITLKSGTDGSRLQETLSKILGSKSKSPGRSKQQVQPGQAPRTVPPGVVVESAGRPK